MSIAPIASAPYRGLIAEDELLHVAEDGGGRSWWARAALFAALAALGCLVMQALHEAGHVIHAWLSGATVERVELHPLELSRTILGLNRRA